MAGGWLVESEVRSGAGAGAQRPGQAPTCHVSQDKENQMLKGEET